MARSPKQAPSETVLAPDRAMISDHLKRMFSRVPDEYPGGRLEIRCLKPNGGKPVAQTFDAVDGLVAAADFSVSHNEHGYNVYVGINPRDPHVAPFGACSTDDVEGAFFCVADLDRKSSVEKYKNADGPEPTFSVITGSTPDLRGHLYFELEDFCQDLEAWKQVQRGLIGFYDSDPAIKDAPRIMRLAGSVSYPSDKKTAKGYVPELVRLREKSGQKYPVQDLLTIFPTSELTEANPLNLGFDKPLDVEGCVKAIASGEELHNNALKLAAHYVVHGHGNADIRNQLHELLQPASDGGTLGQIDYLIQSARNKFNKPEPSEPVPLLSSADEILLNQLARLSHFEYDRVRGDKAKELGVRTAALDKEVDNRRARNKKNGEQKTLSLSEYEPWSESVDGTELMGQLVETFNKYLALSDGAAEALALWVIHCFAFDAFQITPRLAITSPEKRCGKTTCLSVLQGLVNKPLPASNITAAAVFRVIEQAGPTLLIDEADTFLNGNDDLRGILNGGHNRSSAHVIRTSGEDHEPKMFATWAPAAIAMIGKLPGTLEDRSIAIQMRRKRPDETVERFRADRTEALKILAQKCQRFVSDNIDALKKIDPDVPAGLHDRAADNWRPLFAIADIVGEHWPQLARETSLKLSESNEDDDSARTQLLKDICGLFRAENADRLASSSICDQLQKMEDRPWPEWKNGKPISPRQLASLLKPFNISPSTVRIDGETVKGYKLSDFDDAFSRYIPVTSVTTSQASETIDFCEDLSVTSRMEVTDRKMPNSAESSHCDAVTDKSSKIADGWDE